MVIISEEENHLKHYGVAGMRWGHRKRVEEGSGRPRRKSEKSLEDRNKIKEVSKRNSDVLKTNPHAAVINHDAVNSELNKAYIRKQRLKKAAIIAGVGLTVAAGAYIYATHKKQIDSGIKSALEKVGNRKIGKISDIPDTNKLSKADLKKWKEIGFDDLQVNTKQDAVAVNWITHWTSIDKIRYDAISDEAYKMLDDKEISLKPGQIIKRVTDNANEVLRDNAFVSFDEDDANRYAAFLPGMWKINGRLDNKPDAYTMAMEALEEIKSPSAKGRVDIFASLIGKDKDFKSEILSTVIEKMDDQPPDVIAKRCYNTFATSLLDRNSSVSKKYIAELKRLGYNAVIDDNDAGRLTRSPLILFNAKSVAHRGTTKITQEHVDNILKTLKPMDNETFDFSNNFLKIPGNSYEKYSVELFWRNIFGSGGFT